LVDINHYDNSIRYVDQFLANVIEIADSFDGSASVVFFSDHGQGLYDDESKLRGQGSLKPISASVEIPLFIWASESFKVSHAERWASIEANQNKPPVQDRFFHAFSGLIGAEFDGYIAADDYFSAQFVEPAVRLYDNGSYRHGRIRLNDYADVILAPTPWLAESSPPTEGGPRNRRIGPLASR